MDKPIVKSYKMPTKEKLINWGMNKILGITIDYDKKIKNAPIKSSYDKFTGGYTTSQRDYRRAKFDAIKDVCQNLAVFGITLLSDENLSKLDPGETSIVDEVQDILGG